MARLCSVLILVAVCLAGIDLSAASHDMRWRIFADKGTGISFRYPFEYHIPNQYHPGVTRTARGTSSASVGISGEEMDEMTMKEIRAKLMAQLREGGSQGVNYDVEVFSAGADDMPSDLAGKSFEEIAAGLCGHDDIDWSSYDYYSDVAARPHVTEKWAPKGIEAMRGANGSHTGIALKYGDRVSVVLVTGGISDHDNAAILDSVEVMVEKRGKFSTWRQAACARKQVITSSGEVIRAPRGKQKVSWNAGWEFETENYHITSNVSPAHLMKYAVEMEALYKSFVEIYQPDSFPPHKMEIMVFKDQNDFMGGSASIGVGGLGPGVLGFFSPSKLCIFAWETYEKSGGMRTFSTLAHEASHQFLHVTCNGSRHVPTWINEGIAVYFESGEVSSSGRLSIKLPKERLGQLYNYYSDRKTTLWPVEQYLNHYGHIPGLNYAEVFVMVHFWVFGVKGGRERFQKYWKKLLKGEDGTEAFEEIFMKDLIEKFGDRGTALEEVQRLMVLYQKKLK